MTEQGVTWRDIRYRGTGPATGRPCEPAQPYLLPTLARLDVLLRSGRPLEPVDPKGRFFNTIGDPIVWFYKTEDGDYEFNDAPGVRPMSGDQLQPVTKSAVEDWERREAAKAEAERQRLAALENVARGQVLRPSTDCAVSRLTRSPLGRVATTSPPISS